MQYSSAHAGTQFRDFLSRREVEHIGGTSEGSAEGTTHSYADAETAAFADWINTQLDGDEELKNGGYIPIDSSNNYRQLFQKAKDGILLW